VAAGDQTLQRRIAAALLWLSFGVVIVAERDLKSRSAQEVRGSRLLWRLGSGNALIALAYLRWGRVR
jgi:hypothetical protein